jgi:tetratricopeptide (TPR) repeat protein
MIGEALRHGAADGVGLAQPGALLALVLFGALLLATAAPARAAETVIFNESAAHQCYLAALRGADAAGVELCDSALEHQGLKREDYVATLSNRGLLLGRSGRFQDALRDHDRAIEMAPEIASLYINRANTQSRARQYDAAMTDLDRAIEVASRPVEAEPQTAAPEAVAGAGGAGAPAGDPGLQSAEVAAPLPVPDPSIVLAAAHYNRALLHQRRGDLSAALTDARRANTLAPDRGAYGQYVEQLQALSEPGAMGPAAAAPSDDPSP